MLESGGSPGRSWVDDLPGVLVRALSPHGDDLGTARLPHPVEEGDAALLSSGPLLRVVTVLHVEDGAPLAVVLEPEPG